MAPADTDAAAVLCVKLEELFQLVIKFRVTCHLFFANCLKGLFFVTFLQADF